MKHKLSTFLLLLFIFQSISAQTINGQVSGYGTASYTSDYTGKFMKSWLLAGPFTVSNEAAPDDNAQQQAFKEDYLSSVNVVTGKPLGPVRIKNNEIKWQQFF